MSTLYCILFCIVEPFISNAKITQKKIGPNFFTLTTLKCLIDVRLLINF